MNIFINIKDFLYYNRKVFLFGVVIITGIILYLIVTGFMNENSFELSSDFTVNDLTVKENESVKEKTDVYEIYVDVKGYVKSPGMYKMSPDDRVIDAINMAGGLLLESDTSTINLSMKLKDEMVIFVDKKSDDNEKQSENIRNDASTYVNSNESIDNNNNNNSSNNKTLKISINKASVNELLKVNGIGEVKAQKIVEYRNKNGAFKSLEELKNVSGIGNATYEKIKDYLTL